MSFDATPCLVQAKGGHVYSVKDTNPWAAILVCMIKAGL